MSCQLANDISFRPTAFAGCKSVTDGQTDILTDHAKMNFVAVAVNAFSDAA